MDGIPNINFYYVFTFFYFFFGFHDSGVGGGGRCHCPRFSPVDTAVIFVPRQYLALQRMYLDSRQYEMIITIWI